MLQQQRQLECNECWIEMKRKLNGKPSGNRMDMDHAKEHEDEDGSKDAAHDAAVVLALWQCGVLIKSSSWCMVIPTVVTTLCESTVYICFCIFGYLKTSRTNTFISSICAHRQQPLSADGALVTKHGLDRALRSKITQFIWIMYSNDIQMIFNVFVRSSSPRHHCSSTCSSLKIGLLSIPQPVFIQFYSFSISWKCVLASMSDSQVLEAKAEVKVKAPELAAEDGDRWCLWKRQVLLFMKCAMSNLNNTTS